MYFSDEIIEEVRSRNDIVDVISSYVKLKRSGGTYFGLCPFHNEKTPSFSVTPRKQMFYCFGCHKGGSVYTFVQEYENCTFSEAVKLLADRAGITLPEEQMSEESRRRGALRTSLLEINKLAAQYYYYQLRSPKGKLGMDYLTGRALSEETMKSFGLGYAGQVNDALYQYMKTKNISDDLLKKSGLFTFDERRGVSDKFWNRVMFPIMDTNNRVIGFGGRVMGDAKPKYLNSPENEIFNKRRNLYGLNAAKRTRENYLILCEGYMDVIAMHQAGFTNAVASLGTAFTEEHANLLRRYTKEVILSYDSDQAGVSAALRAIPMLKAEGISVRILHLEPYKDPDEFIKAKGAEALRARLDEAQNSFLFEIDVLKRQFDLQDPEGRTRFQMAVADRIAQLELEAERENYMQALARDCMMTYEAMRQLVLRALARGVVPEKYLQPQTDRRKKAETKVDGMLTSERMLLTWLTEYPGLYAVLKEYVKPEDYSTPFYQEAARMLYAQMEEGEVHEAAIIDHFTDEEQQKQAAQLFHANVQTDSEEQLKKSIRETIRKVSDDALRRRSKDGVVADLQAIVAAKKRSENIGKLDLDLSRKE